MKKGIIISIGFIILSIVLEGLYFLKDTEIFGIEICIVGVISMVIGVRGLLRYLILPMREERAKTLGQLKKQNLRKK